MQWTLALQSNSWRQREGKGYKTPPSNERTKPGSEAQACFRRKPHLETQATEGLYKDAPPSALVIIDIVLFKPLTSQ